jgi:hypothetical protein
LNDTKKDFFSRAATLVFHKLKASIHTIKLARSHQFSGSRQVFEIPQLQLSWLTVYSTQLESTAATAISLFFRLTIHYLSPSFLRSAYHAQETRGQQG